MKHTLPKQILFAFSLLLIVFACQEDTVEVVEDPLAEVDYDMIAATELVNEYLNATGAKTTGNNAITSIRFIDGQLMYSTNNDTIQGYRPITEETVTASISPGEFVFWFAGQGVSDLDGIDFDPMSQSAIGDLPSEIAPDLLWTIVLPDEIDSTKQHLKYDIIYDFEGNTGDPIRLDPKLSVTQ